MFRRIASFLVGLSLQFLLAAVAPGHAQTSVPALDPAAIEALLREATGVSEIIVPKDVPNLQQELPDLIARFREHEGRPLDEWMAKTLTDGLAAWLADPRAALNRAPPPFHLDAAWGFNLKLGAMVFIASKLTGLAQFVYQEGSVIRVSPPINVLQITQLLNDASQQYRTLPNPIIH